MAEFGGPAFHAAGELSPATGSTLVTSGDSRPLRERILLTFAAPRTLFADLNGHAPWFGVLLISTMVAAGMVYTIPEAEFLAQMENPVNRRGAPVVVTSGPDEIVRYGRYLWMLSTVVLHPLTAFALAGVLALVFTGLLGGRASYRQYLSITAHALLITALGKLLLFPFALRWGAERARLSPALLMPGLDPNGFAYALWSGLNLFTVWALVVSALGVSVVNRDRSWASAGAITGGAYLLLAVATAAVTT